MPTTRYKNGLGSATISHELGDWCKRVLAESEQQTLQLLETEAEKIAENARKSWYTLVDRETGKSGQIDVVTTFDTARGRVTVGVGSLDDRTDPKSGKPTVVFIRSPGRNSTIKESVTREEYYQTPELLRANYQAFPDQAGKGPFILAKNPKAGSSKNLLQSLIKGPVKLKIKDPMLLAQIEQKLKSAAKSGGR